jgi:hypothetical protein
MPATIPCYTTICEQWNEEKIEVLKALGYDVRVLYRRDQKAVSGAIIRQNIAAGGDLWKAMVPRATVLAVEQLELRNRLLRLLQPESTGAKSGVPPLNAL